MSQFASAEDLQVCQALHRKHGTTYYLASRWFPEPFRSRTDALYGFVRVPDEWVDNPAGLPTDDPRSKLDQFEAELQAGWWTQAQPVKPSNAALRCFCDVGSATRMPIDEPLRFLAAMRQDLTQRRYATYEDLEGYMRGSAAAVGLMMLSILEVEPTAEVVAGATALGNAMQLTNFLRDVAEDAERGRIYLPLEDLDRHSVAEHEILEGNYSERFCNLMRFQAERARQLYSRADEQIAFLPLRARKPVKMARELYARILDRIERQQYDVFRQRARTSSVEKLSVATRVLLFG
jgi:phytoene synthase